MFFCHTRNSVLATPVRIPLNHFSNPVPLFGFQLLLDDVSPETETSMSLERAIEAMLKNVPPLLASSIHEDPQKAELTPYQKAKLMSKYLPPADKQIKDICLLPADLDKKGDKSPQPPPSTSSIASPQSCTSVSSGAALSPPIPSRTLQNRPSVLRIGPSLASREPITIYNDGDNCAISSTTNASGIFEVDTKPSLVSGQIGDCSPPSFGQIVETKPNLPTDFIKQETPEDENFERISTTPSSNERGPGVVRSVENSTVTGHSPASNERMGVVVRRSPSKRQYDYDETFSPVPIKKSLSSPPPNQQYCQSQSRLSDNGSSSPFPFGKHLSYPLDIEDHVDVHNHLTSPIDDFGSLTPIDQCNQMTQFVDVGKFRWSPIIFFKG